MDVCLIKPKYDLALIQGININVKQLPGNTGLSTEDI